VRRLLLALLLPLLSAGVAWAQSSPGIFVGQVPTPQQWNSYFAAKQDYVPGLTNPCTSIAKGLVPTPPGDPTQFLNGDCVWAPVSGLVPHAPVALATAAPLPSNTYNNGSSGVGATLTGNSTGLLTVDGVAATVGMRVLVRDESAGANNGAYVVTTNSGGSAYVLTRATDFNTPTVSGNLAPNSSFLVAGGNTLINTTWIMTTVGTITVGATPLTFTEFASGNVYSAGAGLALTGAAFSLALIANNTVMGNVSGGSAVAVGLNSTQLTTLCGLFSSSVSGCVPSPGPHPTYLLSASGWITPPSAACALFTSSTPGCVPASGGGSLNVLRADGVWANGIEPPTANTSGSWIVATTTSGYNAYDELETPQRTFQVGSFGSLGSGAPNGDWAIRDATAGLIRWSVEQNGGLVGWPSTGLSPGAADLGPGTINVSGGYYVNGVLISNSLFLNVQSVNGVCAPATGDGTTNDTAAIQCQINLVSGNAGYNHGILFFPSGNYLTTGLTVQTNVWLMGAGRNNTVIKVNADNTVLSFPACSTGNNFTKVTDMTINGYRSYSGANAAVFVGENCNPTIADSNIWGGYAALLTYGSDAHYTRDFISGYHINVLSYGNAWYLDDKLDDVGFNTGMIAFYQATPYCGGCYENHIVETDMSVGGYSMQVEDSSGIEVMTVSASIFGGPVLWDNGADFLISAAEFNGAGFTANQGTVTIGQSWSAGAGLHPSGSAGWHGQPGDGSGNINITIP
jgi:hypothetical protein